MNRRRRIYLLSVVVTLFLLQPKLALATWSIAAVDPKTKQVGIAGASCTDFVYGIAGIAPGKGAIVAQAMSNMEAKSLGEKMLSEGKSPAEVLAAITDPKFDADFALQQYGIVALGFEKSPATYSGAKIAEWNGSLKGFGVTVQGNILTDKSVVENAFEAFKKTAKNKKSVLADRLMDALEAGMKDGGGDKRCKEQRARSAFVVVETVVPNGKTPYLLINVTGQEAGDENPITPLRRKYDAWRREGKIIKPRILEKYVGKYETSPTDTVAITLENRQLFAQGTGSGKVPLFALSERKFFLKNAEVEMSFNADAQGRIVSMTLWKNGRETQTLKKL